MPAKSEAPSPKRFPCHIGVDHWLKLNKTRNKSLVIFYKYTDAMMDIDGWADPKIWLPLPFDLCWIRTDKKTKTGWWTGKIWEGLRLRAGEKILYWKKCNEDMG